VATFSEPLASATVTTATVKLAGPGNVAVPATVSYDSTSLTATLTPSTTLAQDTTYTATVTTGVTDQAGNPLAAPVSWSFTTLQPDDVPPAITTTSPTDGATGVAVGSPVTATFSEAMAAASLTTSSFTLSGPSGAVPASVSYSSATTTATLAPTAALAAGATYTATVTTTATDLSGNPLTAPVSWSFTTASDTVAPTVTATSPVDGATGVAVGSAETATFSEPMDPATLTGSTFTLSGPGGAVPASVGWNAGTATATLTPDSPLTTGAVYVAAVTTGATDVAGNPLAAPVSWSFTTAGGGAQTVTLDPTADAYVTSDLPTSNFGSATSLAVDGTPDAKAYLKYDLSPYAGRTVQSATLAVPVTTSGSTGKQNVRLTLKDTWTESTLTYNNKPGLDTTLGTLGPTSAATTYSVPLTAGAVQGKVGGVLSLGLSTTSADDVLLAARESGTPVQLVLVLG
jgi:hypothetical protein